MAWFVTLWPQLAVHEASKRQEEWSSEYSNAVRSVVANANASFPSPHACVKENEHKLAQSSITLNVSTPHDIFFTHFVDTDIGSD